MNTVENEYHSIEVDFNEDSIKMDDENGPAHWSSSRFNHVITLREEALNYARRIWSDYILVIFLNMFACVYAEKFRVLMLKLILSPNIFSTRVVKYVFEANISTQLWVTYK